MHYLYFKTNMLALMRELLPTESLADCLNDKLLAVNKARETTLIARMKLLAVKGKDEG